MENEAAPERPTRGGRRVAREVVADHSRRRWHQLQETTVATQPATTQVYKLCLLNQGRIQGCVSFGGPPNVIQTERQLNGGLVCREY